MRDSLGMLTVIFLLYSKEPWARQQPRSRRSGLERSEAWRFSENVSGVQTEVVARRPARMGVGLVGGRSLLPDMTRTEVRRRERTDAAFSPASRIHCFENVGFTSKTA